MTHASVYHNCYDRITYGTKYRVRVCAGGKMR